MGDAKTQHDRKGLGATASWDDFRIFLICAEKASFRAAGRVLGLDSATVIRRIERLEQSLGWRLFVRHSEGVRLSDEGQRILNDVRAMERASFNIARQSQINPESLRGLVKVAITEGLGIYWVLPRLLEFQKSNRLLAIEMECTMARTDVGRLEADISIQFTRAERPDLIAVRLGYLHIYPFVSKSYVRQFGMPASKEELPRHRIIHQTGALLDESARELGLDDIEGIVGFRTNGSTAVLYAVERDAGIGFLPSYASALAPNLVPVDIGIRRRLEIWMTYHPNLRQSRRHMFVVEWLRKIFDARALPCFSEEFIHPLDLMPMMAESAKISGGEGFAAAFPAGSNKQDIDSAITHPPCQKVQSLNPCRHGTR